MITIGRRGLAPGYLVRIVGIALALAVLIGSGRGALAAQDGSGLGSDDTYAPPQFVGLLGWSAPWQVDERLTESRDGKFDRLVLRSQEATFEALYVFTDNLDAGIEALMTENLSPTVLVQVLGSADTTDASGDPYRSVTLAYDGEGPSGDTEPLIRYIEARLVIAGMFENGAQVLSLTAPADGFARVYRSTLRTVSYPTKNAGPIFAGTPGTTPDAGGTDPAAAYLTRIGEEIDRLTTSVDQFTALMQDPNLGDDATMRQLAGVLATWVDAYKTAQTITPPAGYEELHRQYLGATKALATAATDLANWDLAAAAADLKQAQDLLVGIVDWLQHPVHDPILDRKSG